MARAGAHGLANTGINAAFGGDVSLGSFATASVSSLVSSGLNGPNVPGAVTIGGSALVGGVTAELSGGDFWRGAGTGAIVAGLNHVMHRETDPPKKKSKAGEAASKLSAASTGLSAVEEVTDLIRSGQTVVVPVYDKAGKVIDGWRVISKQTGKVLVFIKAGAGFGGYLTAGLGFGADVIDLSNGDTTWGRFSYHTAGTVASIAASTSSAGLGALVGGAFMLGEMAYDMWINTVLPAMSTAMPTGNWSGFRGFR